MGKVRVSVVLAVYNSERFLKEQIDSILRQIKECDELVISYNLSNDKTWEIINTIADKDHRVKIVVCMEKGIVPNFESAISNAKGKYIFLSDHDDVWLDKKLEKVIEVFELTKCDLVLHGRYVTDSNLRIQHVIDYKGIKIDAFSNFVRNNYCGSCMAFKQKFIKLVCPIPRSRFLHDRWIGILISLYGNVYVMHEPLIFYRRHGDNASTSQRRDLYVILIERLLFLCEVLKRIIKIGNFDSKSSLE